MDTLSFGFPGSGSELGSIADPDPYILGLLDPDPDL
jgi:hypothetical protein